ncbi:MAG: DUF2198 family protein [Staphylococcus epidermidis]|nr:DUF2198 family protein [Staphylococcus epidermidis]
MIWYVCAAFFPCILVVLNEWIIFIDVTSLLAGYLIIDQLEFHKNQNDS